jgi:hypothetical protein
MQRKRLTMIRRARQPRRASRLKDREAADQLLDFGEGVVDDADLPVADMDTRAS